jgi:hypothetical protein
VESAIDYDGQNVLGQICFHTLSQYLIGGHRYPVELQQVDYGSSPRTTNATDPDQPTASLRFA